MAIAQCGTLDNPLTDQTSYCSGEQMLLSIDGFNLEDGTEVEWYWSTTSGFDPYNGEGTFIGDDDGAYNNCDEDPDVGSILVDGCGTGPNGETNSEYVIVESGGGFYIDDFFLTLDDDNDGPPINLLSPGSSGCPWQDLPYTQYVTGCSSVIGLGPGDFVPANSILIVQTSSDYNYTLNANSASLCGADGCIYVVTSNCNRTGFGAFSNSGSSSLRTTDFDFGCTSVSITYDRADIGGAGTYIDGNENISSVPCAAIPSPGDVTNYQIPTTFDDVPMTVPATWCGSTIYFKAIIDVNDVGDCCAEISSDEISITFNCPDANAAGPAAACELNGTYTYNLAQFDATLSGGLGTVTWYTDAATSSMILDPTMHQTSNSSVWAVVSIGGCDSAAEEVILTQLTSPTATQFDITGCTSLNPYNLDLDANPNINGTETITWYETDPSGGGVVQIGPPTNAVDLTPYNGGSIWAQVEDANGCTTAIEVTVDADEIPTGCVGGALEICETGCETFTFTFTGGSGTYDAEVQFTFLGLPLGPFSFPAITNASGFTLCFDPNLTLPDFSNGDITLPTCDPFGFFCLGEGDIITLELLSVVDANTGCAGTVAPSCIQSIEFHADPDITVNQVDPTCFGETTGSIDLDISNGNPTYTFMWNNGLPSTEDQANLGMGTYEVTVTDNLGCSATEEIVIAELDEITLAIIVMDETCEDDNDGAITVTPSNGVPIYMYDWDNDTYDGLDVLTNLPDGSYTVTVTDAAGCTKEETITILPGATTVIPMFTISMTYCQNDLSDPLVTVSDNGVSGSWSELSIDTDNEGVTDYTFTPDPGQCSNPIDLTVTVVLEPILTIFDIQCDGSNYTFEVEVEGSPNTAYDLSGTSVIPPNSNTTVTNGSGFGSETFVIPNSMTSVTLQVILPTSPFCVSNTETVNSPTCECPSVNIASLNQTLCHGQIADLSDVATGFSIATDPNGYAGDLIWTTNNLDPDNGGTIYTSGAETNQSCSVTTLELYAWLECEIDGNVDSYVPSGSITVSINPDQPTLSISVFDHDLCSNEDLVIEYYLVAADGTQCQTSLFEDVYTNNSCDISMKTIQISFPDFVIENILGVTDNSCTSYSTLSTTELINVYPAGFTVNTSGDGECTDLIAELLAMDGSSCADFLLACQDDATVLDFDFAPSLGFIPITACPYDNLTGSLSCNGCGCSDPVIVDAGENQEICAVAGTVFDLTSLSSSISGAVSDGLWLGGSGIYDSQIFSIATSYLISQGDIDAGSILISLVSDNPTEPDCIAISDEVTLTLYSQTEDILILEMPCEDSGYIYTSPSGMEYNLSNSSGNESLTDDNGCAYSVSVTIDYQALPTLTILNIECDEINDTYSIVYSLVGQIDSNDEGNLGLNEVTDIPNDTPLTLLYSNNGLCQQTLTIPNPDCSCPTIEPPVSLGNRLICEGDQIPPLVVNDSNGNQIDWYSDPTGMNFLVSGASYLPTAAGTYYAGTTEVLSGCQSTILIPVTLTIATPPMITTSSMCDDDGFTYQVEFSLSSTLPAMVTHSTGNLTDLGNGNYSIEGIDINNSVVIVGTLLDVECGSTITVPPPQCDCPLISQPISLGNQVICEGDPMPQLEVTIGSGQEAYWYNDILLTNLVSTGTTHTPTDAGIYYVISEDISSGCLSSETTDVILTIVELPIPLSFTFECSIDLLSYSVIIGYENNQDVTLSTSAGTVNELPNSTYEVSGVPASMSFDIVVSSTLVNNCTNETQINAPNCSCPNIDPPINSATEQYCFGDPIPSLTTIVTNGMTTQWYGDAQLTQLLSTDNPYTPDSPGTFYITAYDISTDCESIPTELTLIENALPVLNSFTAYCDDSDPNFYTVEFTQSSEQTALVSAGSPATADGTFVIVTNIPINEDLIINLTNNITSCENSVTIPSPDCDCIDPPLIQLDSPGPICAGELIMLNATGTGFTDSSWETDGDGSFANQFDLNTVYTPGSNDIVLGTVAFEFTAEDPDGSGPCDEVIATESVIINALPPIPSVSPIFNFCKGEQVMITDFIDESLIWYDSNFNLLAEPPIVNTNNIGQEVYYLSQIVDNCVSELLEITINVFDIGLNYTIQSSCTDLNTGQIIITEFIGTSTFYSVVANDILYGVMSTDVPFTIDYPLNTPIILELANDIGCLTFFDNGDQITQPEENSATITQAEIDLNTYYLSYFVDLPADQINTLAWSTSGGNLSCSDCPNPEITITQNETVELEITTVDGCIIIVETVFLFEAPEVIEEVFIPNIFKPGTGDDNSMFYPQSKDDLGMLDRLSIYDRWGTLIYNTTQQSLNDPTIGWDGTYQGALSEQGVYIYAIEITTPSGKTLIMAGDITVVR